MSRTVHEVDQYDEDTPLFPVKTSQTVRSTKSSNSIKTYESVEDVFSTSSSDDDSDQFDADVLMLPKVIRETVPLTDDVSVPVITFRYFLLATLFIVPGAFIDTLNAYRTTSAAYSIFFVQIASHWAGKWLAEVLPRREVNLRFIRFNLNPGPWSIKETAMVTITANSGATGSMATNAISLAELYFGETIPAKVAIPFMFSIVFVGYSYAAIAKSVLMYDTQLTWPQALMQTALFQSQSKSNSKSGAKQMRVFFWVLSVIAVWQFFPEFIFPMSSSLAVLCWMAPYSKTLNFIGSGMGGMGVLNFSLDWANITSQIMLYPYWIQVIQFAAFVLGAWVLIPLVKWGNLGTFEYGLMSNSLFLTNGSIYPTNELLTADLKLNLTAYEFYGPVHIGAQRAWNMFFDYGAYVSGITWVVLFGLDKFKSSYARFKESKSEPVDRLNKLRLNYKEVPTWWYVVLFVVAFVTLMTILLNGYMFMPWWCCIVALVMGSIIVTPLAWLYALSNFQLAIGTFNELVYGYMVQNLDHKHPAGALVFGSIAGNAWYRAQYHLECMRLGFYNHLPPRAVFLSQLYGELIGIPVNYVVLKWVLKSKREFLNGTKVDPLHQWTGQVITINHTNAIQYVVLGPDRLFEKYPLLPYGFVMGLLAPVSIYLLHQRYPNSRFQFNLWNTTVFFSSMSKFYGNLSTGYFSKFIGGTVTMYWAFNYRHDLWKRYNYILAAALDTGYNLTVLLIFLIFSWGTIVNMPHWWGNNAQSVERCFALWS